MKSKACDQTRLEIRVEGELAENIVATLQIPKLYTISVVQHECQNTY